MREGNACPENFSNQQLTLEDLYKVTLQKIREYINPQPFTKKKIKELLRIFAASDTPLRYTEIVNACSKQRCFMKWNREKGEYGISKEAVEKFVKRYLALLSKTGIIERVNGKGKGYRLTYNVMPKPLPKTVKDIIEEEGRKIDGLEKRKLKIFNLFINLIELKGYLDVTQNYYLIYSIQHIILQLRREIEELKQIVEGSYPNIWVLTKICGRLEDLKKIYSKILRTHRREPSEDLFFEELRKSMDRLYHMPVGGGT